LSLNFERTGTAIVKGKVTPDLAEENSLQYESRTDGITLVAPGRNRVLPLMPEFITPQQRYVACPFENYLSQLRGMSEEARDLAMSRLG
jgi:hypothetical protein